jgi:hypothetical protein
LNSEFGNKGILGYFDLNASLSANPNVSELSDQQQEDFFSFFITSSAMDLCVKHNCQATFLIKASGNAGWTGVPLKAACSSHCEPSR